VKRSPKEVRIVLAGDVGGTKTQLGCFHVDGQSPSLRFKPLVVEKFRSQEHASLDELAAAFLARHKSQPEIACFGVAGPVQHGRSQATNLAWTVDAAHLATELKIETVLVLNDLEANAYGIAALDEDDFAVLQPGRANAEGNVAVISAGTGLGEAGMFWDGQRHLPFACEGGHADFAPRNEWESKLLDFLLREFGHASWERVLSGPGLHNLYRFHVHARPGQESADVARQIEAGEPAAVISRAAHDGTCRTCVEALALFVSLYGAEAGNLALKLMATGGIYLGGGIAPKNLEPLKRKDFLRSFAAKGRMQSLLESMPVRVILSDQTALVGAARCAALHR
jgi:glucokinase